MHFCPQELHRNSLHFTSKQNHFTHITSVHSTLLHFTSLHLFTLNPHLNSLIEDMVQHLDKNSQGPSCFQSLFIVAFSILGVSQVPVLITVAQWEARADMHNAVITINGS